VTVAVSLDLDGLEEFLESLKDLDQVVESGLVASGPAAAYAEVWEWGNARQTKQGPKTVMGINPDGETVWLSTQAPMGYISIHSDAFIGIVQEEMTKLALAGGEGTNEELRQVTVNAMNRIKEIVAEHAPVDTGQLRDCLTVVEDGDASLDDDPEGSIESRFKRVLNIS
jgi:hypothetical protein